MVSSGARQSPPDGVVQVTVRSVGEAELAADALWRAGTMAIEEREAPEGLVLIAGAAAGSDVAPLLAVVARRWPAEVVPVDPDAALDAWRDYARTVDVGDRLVVRPPWVPAAPRADGRLELVIDPGRAFGSGAHPSTQLALAAVERSVVGGERVLDVGCGSGVLAVAALRLGAAWATGVDVDPAALDATRQNAERNGVTDRLTVTGEPVAAVTDAAGRFDLIVANMLLSQLVEVADPLRAALAPGATLVLSGVLTGQRAALLTAYTSAGLHAPTPGLVVERVDEQVDEGWLGLTLRAR